MEAVGYKLTRIPRQLFQKPALINSFGKGVIGDGYVDDITILLIAVAESERQFLFYDSVCLVSMINDLEESRMLLNLSPRSKSLINLPRSEVYIPIHPICEARKRVSSTESLQTRERVMTFPPK